MTGVERRRLLKAGEAFRMPGIHVGNLSAQQASGELFHTHTWNERAGIAPGYLDLVLSVNGLMSIHNAVGIFNANNSDVASTLLRTGADANAMSEFGQTLLLLACLCNYASVIDFLVQAGADVNYVQMSTSYTALHYATLNSKHPAEIMGILLAVVVDPNVLDDRERARL